MATFTFFQDFAEQLGKEQHLLGTDTLNWALSNVAPNAATGTTISDITQIAAGNGYTTGGQAITHTWTETGGTATLAQTDNEDFVASGGAMATFRYAVLYNDTNATDMLIGYIDHGSAVDLADGQTYRLPGSTTLFTLS